VVAQRAFDRTGIPYVLDLRDPHGLGYYESEEISPRWIKEKVYRAMHNALTNARAVVFLFESVAECYLRAFPGALDNNRIHIIPNGYEGTIEEKSAPKAEKCMVVYTGTVTTYRYDTLLCSLVLLKNRFPEQAKWLSFKFAGEGTDALMKEARELGVSDLIETSAALPQSAMFSLLSGAHALLLLGRPPSRKGYELVAGAKLFEYLKANRPIIGVLPDDQGKKILVSLGIKTLADVNSPTEIAAQFRTLIKAWLTDKLPSLLPNRTQCECYSAEQQTKALVQALTGGPATPPFVNGCVELPPSLRSNMSRLRIKNYSWV